MLYIICKAKNEIAMNEQKPEFNPKNWEVLETVKCRKNASLKTYHLIFSPINEKYRKEFIENYRLWNFKENEIKNL